MNMGNTNSDLDERLSQWGVSRADEGVSHGHHNPTPQDQLNEKVSAWGVMIKGQQGTFGESAPRSPHRSGRQSPSSTRRSPNGHSQSPSSSRRSPSAEDRNIPALNEKLSPWEVKLDGVEEDLVLKRRLMREGSEVDVQYFTRRGLQERLMLWGINTETIEHPEVLTVEQALSHLSDFEGMFAKNLFLTDKKKQLYLFCAPHDADVSLGDLAKLVDAPGGLRLAAPDVLEEKLGLTQGAETVFGLINDQFHDVKLIVDNRLLDGTYSRILFYPMINSATTAISPADLKSFLAQTGHKLIDISKNSTVG